MLDKSIAGPDDSQKIWKLISKQRYVRQKPVFMIVADGDKVVLSISDIEKSRVTTYPLDWDTACFIAYCLFVSAMQITKWTDIVNYIESLALRRDEVISWFDEIKSHMKNLGEHINKR